MAVVIRLRREGRKNKAFYRISVTDSRMPREGRFIEVIGHYNPYLTKNNIEINMDKYRSWISKGAKPSLRVLSVVKQYRKLINQALKA